MPSPGAASPSSSAPASTPSADSWREWADLAPARGGPCRHAPPGRAAAPAHRRPDGSGRIRDQGLAAGERHPPRRGGGLAQARCVLRAEAQRARATRAGETGLRDRPTRYDIELLARPGIASTHGCSTDGSSTAEPAPRARRSDAKRFGPTSRRASTTSVRSSTRVLDLLEAPHPGTRRRRLMIAVIEGLTLAACMGRISPEDATDLAIRYATRQQTLWRVTSDGALPSRRKGPWFQQHCRCPRPPGRGTVTPSAGATRSRIRSSS